MITQDQRAVASHVLVNQFKEKCVTVQIVLLMESGVIGFHGNLALCHADLDIRKDTGDVTHQNNNMVGQTAEDPMLKKGLAKLAIALLMEIGQNGSYGPSAVCLVEEAQRSESENVKTPNPRMEDVFVLVVTHKWTTATMIPVLSMETGHLGVIGAPALPLVEEEKDIDTGLVLAHHPKMEDSHAQVKQVRRGHVACKCAPLTEIGQTGAPGPNVKMLKVKMSCVVVEDMRGSGHALILPLSLEEEHVQVMPCRRKNATHNHVINPLSRLLDKLLVTLMMKNLVSVH